MNHRIRLPLLWALLVSLLVSACSLLAGGTPAAPTQGVVSPTVPTEAPATDEPATAPPADTPTGVAPTEPAPTEPAAEGLLPAPLYFISAADSQIWRVERDGTTLTQVTREATPVTYFDVSPATGAIVYVTDNVLVQALGDGSQRLPLVVGPEADGEDRIMEEIRSPRWSPDGQQIAYALAGINLLRPGGGPENAPHVILPSDPFPDQSAGRPETMPRFFIEGRWSPDASRMLVQIVNYPEGGTWAVLNLADLALTELSLPEGGIVCCNPAWSADSQFVYFSNDSVGLTRAGLWRVPAATGQVETLIQGEAGNDTFYMVSHAAPLADGSLYYFLNVHQGFPDGAMLQKTMHRADAAAGNGTPLRGDTQRFGEALWAPDASGAAIMPVEERPQWPFHGPLQWVPTDGSPVVALPGDGSALAWGQ
jgi:hypothetical protein